MSTIELVATGLGIIATLGTIVGFVGKPIIKLNKTLDRMSITFEVMEKRVSSIDDCNQKEHSAFRIKDAEIEKTVNVHDKDIAVIKQVLKNDLGE